MLPQNAEKIARLQGLLERIERNRTLPRAPSAPMDVAKAAPPSQAILPSTVAVPTASRPAAVAPPASAIAPSPSRPAAVAPPASAVAPSPSRPAATGPVPVIAPSPSRPGAVAPPALPASPSRPAAVPAPAAVPPSPSRPAAVEPIAARAVPPPSAVAPAPSRPTASAPVAPSVEEHVDPSFDPEATTRGQRDGEHTKEPSPAAASGVTTGLRPPQPTTEPVDSGEVTEGSGEFDLGGTIELEELDILGPADDLQPDETVVEISVDSEVEVTAAREESPPESGRSVVGSPLESARVAVAPRVDETPAPPSPEEAAEAAEAPVVPAVPGPTLSPPESQPLAAAASESPVDLAGDDFARADFSSPDLAAADLPGPDVAGPDLTAADLAGPGLAAADLGDEPVHPIEEPPITVQPEGSEGADSPRPAEPGAADVLELAMSAERNLIQHPPALPSTPPEAPPPEVEPADSGFRRVEGPQPPAARSEVVSEPPPARYSAAPAETVALPAIGVPLAEPHGWATPPPPLPPPTAGILTPPAPLPPPTAGIPTPPAPLPPEPPVAVGVVLAADRPEPEGAVVRVDAVVIHPTRTPASVAAFLGGVRAPVPETFGALVDAALSL